MSKYHKQWAKRRRSIWYEVLGGACVVCGEERPSYLTFDCIEPKGDEHHKKDTSARMSFYNQQIQAGNIQLLCLKCNSIKSDMQDSEFKKLMEIRIKQKQDERNKKARERRRRKKE